MLIHSHKITNTRNSPLIYYSLFRAKNLHDDFNCTKFSLLFRPFSLGNLSVPSLHALPQTEITKLAGNRAFVLNFYSQTFALFSSFIDDDAGEFCELQKH